MNRQDDTNGRPLDTGRDEPFPIGSLSYALLGGWPAAGEEAPPPPA